MLNSDYSACLILGLVYHIIKEGRCPQVWIICTNTEGDKATAISNQTRQPLDTAEMAKTRDILVFIVFWGG